MTPRRDATPPSNRPGLPRLAAAWARVRDSLRASSRPLVTALAARVPAARAAVPPDLAAPPAPMRPLLPPAAINDNPLEAVHEAVERELRARGHLR